MKCVFRVDASSQIGAGHFARCLTLADALRGHGAQIRFVCRHMPEAFAEMLSAKRHELVRLPAGTPATGDASAPRHSGWLGVSQEVDADQAAAVFAGNACDWLIVDHYALDARWERRMHLCATNILAIDDLADRQHDCDVLLDQNFYADTAARYVGRVPERCELMLGPRYALLRDEFRIARQRTTVRSGTVRRILVFAGGVDAMNFTMVAIQALAALKLHDIHVDVALGSQHARRDEIESACARQGYALHVQTPHMADLMAAADLAIGAGGTATWERCCVGLPALVVAIAENQQQLVHDSALAGLLYAPRIALSGPEGLERHLLALIDNPLLLASISHNAMHAVDGRGVQRLLRKMGICSISLRRAVAGDAKSMFEWRNDPAIRQVSRATRAIEWPTHQKWFESVLVDTARHLLIGESGGRAVGVVRFDVVDAAAEISIYLVPGRHQQGTGADLLAAAERWLARHEPNVRQLRAEVRGDNLPSHRLFASADYRPSLTGYTKEMKQ